MLGRSLSPPLVLALLGATALACGGPEEPSWGLDAIARLRTPADPVQACGATLPSDPAAASRAACRFGAGAHAAETLGLDAATRAALPVRHVIVVMQENRSFDHLLGHLHDHGQPDAEPIPAGWVNRDLRGVAVAPFAATTTCLGGDPDHQHEAVDACVDGGKMDGFVKSAARSTRSSGHLAMATYDAADLPFYYWLAATFAVNDRHFASMDSGTFPNRNFLLLATNAGVESTGKAYPPPTTPSLMRLLLDAGFTWGVFTDGEPLDGTLGWNSDDPGVHPLRALYDALDAGTLPSVAFVDGRAGIDDDHPTADLQRGEAWLAELYRHAAASPQWSRLAIVWTHDEAGGFADHVPPPDACAGAPGGSTTRGPRVPLVVISPWARRGYVSHVVEDHTAITRLVEALFGLPALTARDANSSALLELFDFACDRDLTPPVPPAPGTGGCRP